METSCLLIRAICALNAVEKDSVLLLALAILEDSATIAEQTVLDGTLLDLSDILTIEKGK